MRGAHSFSLCQWVFYDVVETCDFCESNFLARNLQVCDFIVLISPTLWPLPTETPISPQDARFVTALELAVRFGKTLIVSECDRIEPMLVPLLRRDAVVQGPRRMVPLGDKLVDFAPGFRLVLATRSPAPDLPPDTRALVTEVNFTVTASGLEAQVITLGREMQSMMAPHQSQALQ